MITVKTKLLPEGNLSNAVYNAAAEGLAETISGYVRSKKCPNGHSPRGTITVHAKAKGLTVDKSGFCCQELSDLIDVSGIR